MAVTSCKGRERKNLQIIVEYEREEEVSRAFSIQLRGREVGDENEKHNQEGPWLHSRENQDSMILIRKYSEPADRSWHLMD
jgi:hypothetical protein